MGRPTKAEPRNEQLNLSLTAKELESIRQRAQALGLRPVHFGRALLLDRKHLPADAPSTKKPVERLLCNQLMRIGNLLNQLVRHLHRTGDAKPADLEPLLADIRQLIARIKA